jgi:hypothetical protein
MAGRRLVGAYELWQLLHPNGVLLPGIIAERLDQQFPHLVLERLPGTDLGHVIPGVSDWPAASGVGGGIHLAGPDSSCRCGA